MIVQRLLAEGRDAGLERPDGDGGVLVVGRSRHQDGVQAAGEQLVEVAGDTGRGDARRGVRPAPPAHVTHDGDFRAVARLMGVSPQPGAQAETHDADLQILFHEVQFPSCWFV